MDIEHTQLLVELRPFESGLSITFNGDLDQAAEQALKRKFNWEEGLGGGKSYLILNLHATPYINSGGMALLIRIARNGRKKGYHTFICGVTRHYQKLFRMVGLTEYAMLYPDEYAVFQRIEALGGTVD